METVVDRNLVLIRFEDKYFLPTTEPLNILTTPVSSSKPYIMCRVTAYKEHSGVLELQLLPDLVSQKSFDIAIEENSELLLSLNLEKLIIHSSTSRSTLPSFQYEPRNPPRSSYTARETSPDREIPPARETEATPIKEVLDLPPVEIPVKDIRFEDGRVSFEHFVNQAGKKVTFYVDNTSIKQEHDSIKNYFAKALNIKKFTFNLHIELLYGRFSQISATSPHIDKINDSLFQTVEEFYIEDFYISNSEDEVYDANERTQKTAKELGSDKIQDTDYLLSKLITKERTKHYYHLRYLSHNHLSSLFNLHLTGNPLSFIFLLVSGSNYFLVWETYKTDEATYVWKLPTTEASQLSTSIKELVEKIKWLRKSNKLKYLKEKPEGFTRIEHVYNGEDMGFNKWKEQLNEFLSSGQESKA